MVSLTVVMPVGMTTSIWLSVKDLQSWTEAGYTEVEIREAIRAWARHSKPEDRIKFCEPRKLVAEPAESLQARLKALINS